MGKELAPGILDKYIAYSGYLGNESEIAVTAYGLYLDRLKNNIAGSAIEDWIAAEKIVGQRFVQSLTEPHKIGV